MGTDLEIDASTRDYVDDGAGGWVMSENSRAAVFCQLECRYGAWPGDPKSGSRIGELLESGEPVTGLQLRDLALEALQALVDAAIIADLVVELDKDEAGRPTLVLNYTDRTTGTPVDVAYSPWGGSP